MGAAQTENTIGVREWIGILEGYLARDNERKREFLRWTGFGVTAVVLLAAWILERLSATGFGYEHPVALVVLFCLGYLVARLAFQMFEVGIHTATRVVIAGVHVKATKDDSKKAVDSIGDLNRVGTVFSGLGVGILVTIVIAVVAVYYPNDDIGKAAGFLVYLRLTAWLMALLFLDEVVKKIRKSREKVPPETSKSDRKESRWGLELSLRLRFGHLGPVLWLPWAGEAFYLLQCWLLVQMMLLVAQPSIHLLETATAIALTMGIVLVLLEVSWPVARFIAKREIEFEKLYREVTSGSLTEPPKIAAQVNDVLAAYPVSLWRAQASRARWSSK